MTEGPINEVSKQRISKITEGKRAGEDLWEYEERYRTILESIEEAYFETDLEGNFKFFNDSLPSILEYSKKELEGMNYRNYMPPETAKDIYTLFNEIYRTGKPIRKYGYEVIRKDGNRGFHELFASLIRDANGKPIGFRGIAHDITERKLVENEREKLIKQLQGALAEVKRLSGLLPICSHCKKIRDDKGYWNRLESYLQEHSDAEFSHSVCPECAKKYYPDYNLYEE
jgi:PAS domain S-box-containing protein